MLLAEFAAVIVPSAGVAGFLAGVRYAGRRIPNMLAEATPDQMRVLARLTAEKRKTAR